MSISNRHSIVPFVSGESKAMHGQRLAKIGFKKTANNPVPLKSVCASVPMLGAAEVMENIQRLLPHIGAMLETVQDNIIRAAYERTPDITSIGDDDISVVKCIEFLELEETGGRLTIEMITGWFVEYLAAPLADFLRIKGRESLDGVALDRAIEQSGNAYREMICALSGGKTHYDAKQRAKLGTVIALCADGGTELAERLMGRLEQMEKKDNKVLASLGLIEF